MLFCHIWTDGSSHTGTMAATYLKMPLWSYFSQPVCMYVCFISYHWHDCSWVSYRMFAFITDSYFHVYLVWDVGVRRVSWLILLFTNGGIYFQTCHQSINGFQELVKNSSSMKMLFTIVNTLQQEVEWTVVFVFFPVKPFDTFWTTLNETLVFASWSGSTRFFLSCQLVDCR